MMNHTPSGTKKHHKSTEPESYHMAIQLLHMPRLQLVF